jgi:hypothetical protein
MNTEIITKILTGNTQLFIYNDSDHYIYFGYKRTITILIDQI